MQDTQRAARTQERRAQCKKARVIQENLGHVHAVAYLRARGWSPEGCIAVLCIH